MSKFFKKTVASVLSVLTLVSSGASLLTVNAAKVDEPAVSYDEIYQELYDKYGPVISFNDIGEDAVIYIPGFIATKDYAQAVYKKAVEDSSSLNLMMRLVQDIITLRFHLRLMALSI